MTYMYCDTMNFLIMTSFKNSWSLCKNCSAEIWYVMNKNSQVTGKIFPVKIVQRKFAHFCKTF